MDSWELNALPSAFPTLPNGLFYAIIIPNEVYIF